MNSASHSLHLASIACTPGAIQVSSLSRDSTLFGAQYPGRRAPNVSYLDTIKITMKHSKSKFYPEIQSARTNEIIGDWRTYLSQECVETMIRLNWHHTTR
jgi:hypothetical protein